MVRELASNEAAYRSITLSWFRHSAIGDLFRALAGAFFGTVAFLQENPPAKGRGKKK